MPDGTEESIGLSSLTDGQDVWTALLTAAEQHATRLDPVLVKVAALIPGAPASCAALKAFELPPMDEDWTVDMTGLLHYDRYSVQGALGDVTFTAEIREDGFQFSISPNDYTSYVFDTDDVLTLIGVLQNALFVTQTDASHADTTRLTITRQSLIDALNKNRIAIDALLKRYEDTQHLFGLFSWRSTEALTEQTRMLRLPDTLFKLTVQKQYGNLRTADSRAHALRRHENGVWTLSENGTVIITLLPCVNQDGSAFRLTLQDSSGDAVHLTLDFSPDPVTPPENASSVSAAEFLTQLVRVLEGSGILLSTP